MAKQAKIYFVKSKRDKFFRSGVCFTKAGVSIDASAFSKADLDAILNDSNLIVTKQATVAVEEPAKGASGDTSANKAEDKETV